MPTTSTITGALIPAASDPADLAAILTAYDGSVLRPLTAASDTQAEQRRAGITGTCLVWRTDLRQLLVHPNAGAAGETWAWVGGPSHGEYTGSSTSAPTGQEWGSGALVTDTAATTSPGPGTVSGETVTITRTGVYHITAHADLATVTTSRAYVAIKSSGSTIGRAVMTGDDQATAALTRRVAAGTQIQMVLYHSQPGQVGIDSTRLGISRIG